MTRWAVQDVSGTSVEPSAEEPSCSDLRIPVVGPEQPCSTQSGFRRIRKLSGRVADGNANTLAQPA